MSLDAMKQALEALNRAVKELRGITSTQDMSEVIDALRLAIEQAERQEPVAWGVDWGKAGDIPCVSIIKRLADGGMEVVAVEYAPHAYTARPQRQPLNLNDYINDANISAADMPHTVVQKLQAAIERAYGIGGGE